MKENKVEANKETEKINEEALNALKDSIPQIIQHGENSQVVHIHHEGEGDIHHDGDGEIKLLRAKLKLHKKIMSEMEQCAKENNEKFIKLLKAKDEEIQILKDTIALLKTGVQ